MLFRFFSRKCFFGQLECSVDNAAIKIISKRWKRSIQCPKTIASTSFLKKFPSKCSYEHLECSVGKAAENFLAAKRFCFAQVPKTIRRNIRLSRGFFSRRKFSMDTWSPVLTMPLRIYRHEPIFFSRNPKPIILWFSRKSCFCSISSHGHEESNFDNAPKKLSIKHQKHFTHCPKTIKKTIFLKTRFSIEMFLWTLRMQCGNPVWECT